MSDDDFKGFEDDLDGVIPDSLPDNTYLCELIDCANTTSKEDGRKWLIFKWRVIEDTDYFGEDIGPEVYRVFSAAEYERAEVEEKAILRKIRKRRLARLESLGVARDRLKDFNPDDLKGIRAHLSVRIRPRQDAQGENFWIDKVVLAESVGSSVTTDF